MAKKKSAHTKSKKTPARKKHRQVDIQLYYAAMAMILVLILIVLSLLAK